MDKLVGTHINSLNDINKVYNTGGTIVQLFAPNHKEEQNYKKELDKYNMKSVIHISYSINLAKDWDEYSWQVLQFIKEIECANKLNALFVVVHLGKQMKLSKEEAYNNMYTLLLYIHEETKQYSNIKILLETSTGQGSELCFKLDDFAYFFKKITKHKNKNIKKRFGICLDTCHVFSAGYDIKNKKNVTIFLNKFERMIGIKYIKLVHMNDSKNDIGSLLDRHESIMKGYIGKGLIQIIRFFKKIKVPIILETPNDSYQIEIRKYLY
jgi:deoxyribonuclease-4